MTNTVFFFDEFFVQPLETLVSSRRLCSVTLKNLASCDQGRKAYGLIAYFIFSFAECNLVLITRVCRYLLLLFQKENC